MKNFLYSIVFLLLPFKAFAFELWQGLEFDSTAREITQKFPTAMPDTSSKFLIFGFDQVLVRPNYTVLDTDFDVTFLMKGHKLKEVRMRANPLTYPDILWSDAYDALSLKYGEPSTDHYKRLKLHLVKWSSSGVEISLLMTPRSDELYIMYSASLADNASKL